MWNIGMVQKTRRQDRDDSAVMPSENGNSQASLARVHFKAHNQPYNIVTTSSHSDCKAEIR